MIKKQIVKYISHPEVYQQVINSGYTSLQANIVANRCQQSKNISQLIEPSLSYIAPPLQLIDCVNASARIIKAIEGGEHIGILTDYDVDGITSHAIIFYALRDFFHVSEDNMSSFIGHRIDDGYGISQGLVDKILACKKLPDVIITADCGTSDEKRILQLKLAGIDVIVTDHHAIPDTGIPQSAIATINPTRSDCPYPDKSIAGCLVSWLLMSQLRTALIKAGKISNDSPKLSSLLDFVSLGTIADAVSLSSITNRAVVKSGLSIMNRAQRPCWREMLKLIEKRFFSVEDLGFQIGPRINARSRMSDPFQALFFITAETDKLAQLALAKLDEDNKQRKITEKAMLLKAKHKAKQYVKQFNYSMVVFDEEFHAGVQGIVASRLVDLYGRPTVVFSPSSNPEVITASARTVNSIHIRNILQQLSELQAGLLISFGGHKGAAGLKINKADLNEFKYLFEQQIEQVINGHIESEKQELKPIIKIDACLTAEQLSYHSVLQLEQLQPYGREFEQPCFKNSFVVQFIRQLGKDGEHLSLLLVHDKQIIRSIWFNALEQNEFPDFIEGETVEVIYQIMKDDYRGEGNFQLNIKYIISAEQND
jgi:single-stranded-DNA-specific exonuclease